MKNWHASFNRKNTPWCLCQKEKSCLTAFVEKNSARTYWNFRRKSIIIYRNTINFPKICWRHNMQIEIMSSEAIMMTSWVNWGSNKTWNHISNSYSIKIWRKKIGFTLHPKALQWILYRHVFAHVCYVLQELARTDIFLNGRSFRYWWAVKGERGIKMLGNMCRIWWQKKNWRFYVAKCHYAWKRARMHVCTFFGEMLKMAWNVCKMISRQFRAFWNFARALTRGRTHKLTGRILTLIMINMNKKCFSVMKI